MRPARVAARLLRRGGQGRGRGDEHVHAVAQHGDADGRARRRRLRARKVRMAAGRACAACKPSSRLCADAAAACA